MTVRPAAAAELDHLAHLWHDVWYETHAHLMPPALIPLRTLASFRDRLAAAWPAIRVFGPAGAPVGFCMVKGDELYQLWVAPRARGSGAAAALMADAESHFAQAGVRTAWLACAIGNDRAIRFYQKCGWENVGKVMYAAETSEGPVQLEVFRFEHRIS